MAETYPNRFVQHAAATDRLVNTTATSTLPTIWDRLAQAGVTGPHYFNDLPFLGLWGSKYGAISKPFSQFPPDPPPAPLPAAASLAPRPTARAPGASRAEPPHPATRHAHP